MAGGDLHQPPSDPNQAILERLAKLEQTVAEQGLTLGIGGTEGTRLRVIRGIVATGASASVVTGTGWTVAPSATGNAIISWSVPFSSGQPAVLPCGCYGGPAPMLAEVTSFGPSQTGVQLDAVRRDTGAAADCFINFLAIGLA